MRASAYIKFLWKSKNAHGVHSPFVYDFIKRCFYTRVSRLSNEAYRETDNQVDKPELLLLQKIMTCYKPSKLYVLGDNVDGITKVLRALGKEINTRPWFFSPLAPIPGTIDLAYISEQNPDLLYTLFSEIAKNADESSICIVGNINRSEASFKAWEKLLQHPKATVTANTYAAGIIFFRNTQAEQHFTIRPYKSIILDALLGIRNLWGLLS